MLLAVDAGSHGSAAVECLATVSAYRRGASGEQHRRSLRTLFSSRITGPSFGPCARRVFFIAAPSSFV